MTCLKAGTRLAVMLGLVAGLPAHAGIWCTGKPQNMAMEANGTVLVALEGVAALHNICSVAGQGTYTMKPEACRAVYATLLSTRVTGDKVTLYYSDATLTACSSIQKWSQQPSFYFAEQA